MKNINRNTFTHHTNNHNHFIYQPPIHTIRVPPSYQYEKVNIHQNTNIFNLQTNQKFHKLGKLQLQNHNQRNFIAMEHHKYYHSPNPSPNKIQFNRTLSPKVKITYNSPLKYHCKQQKQNQKNKQKQNNRNNIKNINDNIKNNQRKIIQKQNYHSNNHIFVLNKSNSLNQLDNQNQKKLFQDISNMNMSKNSQFSNSKLQNNFSYLNNSIYKNNQQKQYFIYPNIPKIPKQNSKELLQISFKNQNFLENSISSNSRFLNESSSIFKNYTHQSFYQYGKQSSFLNQFRQNRISHQTQTGHNFTKKNSNQKKNHKKHTSNLTQRIKKALNSKDPSLTPNQQNMPDKLFIQSFQKLGKQSRGSLIRCYQDKNQKKPFEFNFNRQNRIFSASKCQQKQSKPQNKMLNSFHQQPNISNIQSAHKQNFKLLKKSQRSFSQNQNKIKESKDQKNDKLVNKQSNIMKISVPEMIQENQTQFSIKNKINENKIQQKALIRAISNEGRQNQTKKQKITFCDEKQEFESSKSNKASNNSLIVHLIQRKNKRAFTEICVPLSKPSKSQTKNLFLRQNINSTQHLKDVFYNSQHELQGGNSQNLDLIQNVKNQSNLFMLKSNIAISLAGDQQKFHSTVIHDDSDDDILVKIGNNNQIMKLNFKQLSNNNLNKQNPLHNDQKYEKQKIKKFQQSQLAQNRRSKLKKRRSQVSILNGQNSPRDGAKSVKFGEQNLSNKQKQSLNSIKTMRRIHIPKQYQKGKFLGKGYFGEVFFGKHLPTGMLCALKYLKLSRIKHQKMQQSIQREIQCQIALNHPNICKIYEFFYDKVSDSLVLVIQFCQGKELYHIMKEKRRMSQQQTAEIIHQLALAIEYMHRKHVIHRDLKPENIMISQGVVKLCDFGWAVMTAGSRKTMCGTPLYSSPQIVLGKQYDKKVDLWGLGVLTYQMLVGLVPFKVYGQHQLHKIVQDDVTFPSYVDISPKAQDFIIKILNKDPDKRLDIFQIIQHPFLQRRKRVIQRVSAGYPQFAKILLPL